MRTFYFVLLLSGLLPCDISAQMDSSIRAGFYRDFTAIYAANHDLLNASENVRSSLKILSDAYQIGLKPRIKSPFLRNATEITWNTVLKWSTLLWPHKFGHLLRTHQHGGRFVFQQFRFPGVVSSLELPTGASTEHHLLALIGGFEANALSARNIQLDFYRHGGLYNDEFGMAFGHRILYPLYAYAFAAQNPKDPQTWIRQEGDPVNFAHLTWQMGNRAVFNADSTVNADIKLRVIWSVALFERDLSAFWGFAIAFEATRADNCSFLHLLHFTHNEKQTYRPFCHRSGPVGTVACLPIRTGTCRRGGPDGDVRIQALRARLAMRRSQRRVSGRQQ